MTQTKQDNDKTYRTVVEPNEIASILEMMRNITLVRVPNGALSYETDKVVIVTLSMKNNVAVTIKMTDEYIYSHGDYWIVSDWPS